MAKTQGDQSMSNVPSNLIVEALAVYTADKGVCDRANGLKRKHQLAYENQGVPASMIRQLYKEAQLTDDERTALYASEQVMRRATNLWDAETPEDFERMMEQASRTEPASREAFDKLADVRAYADGNNSARMGGGKVIENPKVPGTSEHQQWALGWADGVDETTRVAAVEEKPEPKKKGRPKKATASELLEANAAKFEATPEPEPDPPANSLFSDMPLVPGMPN